MSCRHASRNVRLADEAADGRDRFAITGTSALICTRLRLELSQGVLGLMTLCCAGIRWPVVNASHSCSCYLATNCNLSLVRSFVCWTWTICNDSRSGAVQANDERPQETTNGRKRLCHQGNKATTSRSVHIICDGNLIMSTTRRPATRRIYIYVCKSESCFLTFGRANRDHEDALPLPLARSTPAIYYSGPSSAGPCYSCFSSISRCRCHEPPVDGRD